MTESTKWVIRFRTSQAARFRLFCFPFAGGAASAFNAWHERLPDWVDICAVQYPGRETRWNEPPFSESSALAAAILDGIKSQMEDLPYAFFGHSLGSLMSFEVARLLVESGLPEPVRLFLSARRAPPFRPHPPEMTGLPDSEFKKNLSELNGTPSAVLENTELMALLMPALRADFSLDENYRYQDGPVLHQRFTIYGGVEDFRVPEEQLRAWRDFTKGESSTRIFPGDHFYLKDPHSPLYPALSQELQQLG